MKTATKHPMSDLVLSAFENGRPQDATTIAGFLSGANYIEMPSKKGNGLTHYKVVAQDMLGCLHEQGLLVQDESGWYRLAV